MPLADLIWTALSLILSLLVLSYVVAGDNPLFRVATYAFIGVAAGYVVLVGFSQVIWPQLVLPLILAGTPPTEKALLAVPLVLSLLLFTKFFPRLAPVGNLSMAYLVGIAAAVAIGGAVLGTLFPQGAAAANSFDLAAPRAQGRNLALVLVEAIVLLVGTGATLLYFTFGARPAAPGQPSQRLAVVETAAQVGKVFIVITFGALFAGVYLSAISALVERVYFIWHTLV